MGTKLTRLRQMARADRRLQFKTLIHLLDEEFLIQCFRKLKKEAAPGVDGIAWKTYEVGLEDRVAELVRRMKRWQYRPQPVRRAYIEKGGGKMRPLGIPAVEDKMVQLAIARILEAIYDEGDFLDVSYGFRPGRGCHDALRELDRTIMAEPVGYIVDADIEKFFDTVDHKWLMKFLGVRIADRSFLRLIGRFLKAGVMEQGKWSPSDVGAPQGGNLSPLLSNVFLHYVLDLWFERKLKKELKGYAQLIRYADDFVVCVQHNEEGQKAHQAIQERFAQFGLKLSQEKTRVIEFGRKAWARGRREGKRAKPFYFLGFTHFCDTTRRGSFKVGRRTCRKKYRMKLKAMTQWIREHRHELTLWRMWKRLCLKLQGHYLYYGVSENYEGVKRFYEAVKQRLFKWLNRRSQRKSFTRESFKGYLERNPLPKPKVYVCLYGTAGG